MTIMGRKPTANSNLPKHMRARKRGETFYYFYDTGKKPRKELPLGKCYIEAVRKWADLEGRNNNIVIYFKEVADRYRLEVIPLKAKRTQADNETELLNLLEFFNNPPAPMNEIKPVHIRQYLDKRTDFGKHSTTRANRERALFSHMFNMARSWGVTDNVNPCQGIKGFTETGRDIYIEDKIFNAVYEVASQPLKDAIDLAYFTDQRPGDVTIMSKTQIQGDEFVMQQGKTNSKLRIAIQGKFKLLLERIERQKKEYKVHSLRLICTETGRPMTQDAIRQRFTKARAKAAKLNPLLHDEIMQYQYRDLRAKATTDKSETDGMREAQLLAGHSKMSMTEHYVRNRKGQKVSPTR
jgi:integrase